MKAKMATEIESVNEKESGIGERLVNYLLFRQINRDTQPPWHLCERENRHQKQKTKKKKKTHTKKKKSPSPPPLKKKNSPSLSLGVIGTLRDLKPIVMVFSVYNSAVYQLCTFFSH